MALTSPQDPFLSQAYALTLELLELLPTRSFAVQFPDGTVIPPNSPSQSPQFTLVLNRPGALRRMFVPPSELGMGESYIFGDYDIEGDIVATISFIDQIEWSSLPLRKLPGLIWKLFRLERADRNRIAAGQIPDGQFTAYVPDGQLHSQDRDMRSAQFHYDVSNKFYKLWLDDRMVYSCGYFADTGEGLGAAQKRKLDRVCRKLNLQPGERLLDIGCGWGGLLIRAATEYDAQAVGITLSEAQREEGTARIRAAGLSDRCQIFVCHYEDFESKQPFDKLASIGMFAHVGEEKLDNYFSKAYDLLKPGGLFLLQEGATWLDHCHAGRSWMDRLGLGRRAFTQKYAFPDTWLVDIATTLTKAEQVGLETRDIESLREHYPLTLDHWLRRLEQNKETIILEVGEVTYRCWRLVLAAYLYLVSSGQLTEYQTLFAKPTTSGAVNLPLIRHC